MYRLVKGLIHCSFQYLSISSINAGCLLKGMLINRFFYADDIVIFSPSANGLQCLLDVCTGYAAEHDILFNPLKSQCMLVASVRVDLFPTIFYLANSPLQFTASYKIMFGTPNIQQSV